MIVQSACMTGLGKAQTPYNVGRPPSEGALSIAEASQI
jgi:hypothetical protein